MATKWKIGDKARVNGRSYSNFDALRKRVGTVIEIIEPKNKLMCKLVVEFNDQYTKQILSNPAMCSTDELMDQPEAFDKV